ncbi:MAG TPA: DUF5675 family protein [Flavobacteriaceae bacterium]|nr:DUF5675 family protein [Flavobacteriaceae bacterium]
MEFTLHRGYFKEGTNGALFISDRFLCHTIELSWRDNRRGISCIPEGTYELIPRFSTKFKNHLLVKNVPGRSLILLHPANDAQKELRGCIAPVTYLGGPGKGIYSKQALDKILSLVHQALAKKETITITIKSANYETCRTLSKTNP